LNFRRRKEDTQSGNLNHDFVISPNSNFYSGRNNKKVKMNEAIERFVEESIKRLGVSISRSE
jgi:hypothetical protein